MDPPFRAIEVLPYLTNKAEYLVHGADDEQIPPADAQKQFAACGSKDKTFRVYTAEEGGAQHCQRDYLTLVVAEMWNWLEVKLLRA